MTFCRLSYPLNFRAHPHFFYVELVCNLWFSFELIVKFLFAPNRREFIKQPLAVIDFMATVSFYLDWMIETVFDGNNRDTFEFFSIVRILRLFKLTQHSLGLKILIQTFKASMRV